MSRVITGLSEGDYLRSMRAKAKEEGRCGICRARSAKPGRVTCVACLDMNAARRLARRRHNPDRGRCALCERSCVDGLRVCEVHRERDRAKQTALYRQRAAAGTCVVCGGPREPGDNRMCAPHRARHRVAPEAA